MKTQSVSKASGGFFSALFADRKIATKITIGFAAILAIMFMISSTAYMEFENADRDFSDYERVVHNSNAVSQIDREFLAFRRYVGDTSTSLDENIAAAGKARATVREQIKAALAAMTNPDRVAKLKDINERFEAYSRDFDKVTPMRREQQKLIQEVFDPLGNKMLSALEAQKKNVATQAGAGNVVTLLGNAIQRVLQLRLNIEKSISRHDQGLMQAAEKNLADLDRTISAIEQASTSPESHKQLERVKTDAAAFNSAFLKFAEDSAQIANLLYGEMRAVSQSISDDTVAMRASTHSDERRTQDEFAWAQTVILALALGGLVFGVAFAWLVGRTISRPVIALVPELNKLADGNFNVSLPGLGRKDEIGQISAAVEMVVEKVGATINNIKIAATEVTSASAEISTSTTDLSQRTEEQAASLEETSASMEEISATVKKNAENARQASEFATETNNVAERGGAVVGEAVTAMARIEESSRKISDIIGVIDEIARQTNLLALNAAVEAARAGEAGRGFAVVASEVRSLAQRSSQAAKDIKDLIINSNSQVKDGVDLVNKAGESLNEIVASIKKVTAIVSDIANASIEQSTGIEQINRALTQMDEVTQQNSALVEENAATAKTLEHQAKSMDQRVASFRLRDFERAEHTTEFAQRTEAVTPLVDVHAAPAAIPAPSRVPAPPSRGPAAAVAARQPIVAPKRAAAGINGGGPVGRMHAALATAVNGDADWKEF
jgi:methyl-accepting chemotaxis protein